MKSVRENTPEVEAQHGDRESAGPKGPSDRKRGAEGGKAPAEKAAASQRRSRPEGEGTPPSVEPASTPGGEREGSWAYEVASADASSDLTPIVGGNLRRLRMKRGLSLERLSRASGVSQAMLGQIELGQSTPTINVLWKIARALGVAFSRG